MQRSCIRIPRLNHGENPSKPGTPMPKPQDSPWPRNGEPQAWNRILYLTTNPLLLFTSFPFSLSLASPIPPTTFQHEHRPTDIQLPPLGPAFPKNYSLFLTKQELLSLPTAPQRSRLTTIRSPSQLKPHAASRFISTRIISSNLFYVQLIAPFATDQHDEWDDPS